VPYSPPDQNHVPHRLFVAEPSIGSREIELVTDAVSKGEISSRGQYVKQFEAAFADFVGVSHADAVCNGTMAIHLLLAALDVGPGDEVIVPALTFVATANAVTYTGAKPVFVDAEPVHWNIDATRIEPAITPRTKGIIAVHLYGHPCDMDAIQAVADRHGLWVVEDAAQAHGATYKGKQAGSLARAGAFSFYANKIITTGEGGMIVTDDSALHNRMVLLKNHGMSATRRYFHEVVGYNYRMTNLQAALGVAQMERADQLVAQKRTIAAKYHSMFGEIAGVHLPTEASWARHAHWMVCVVLDEALGWDRDTLAAELEAEGIETRPFFPPVPEMPMYGSSVDACPVAARLGRTGMNLPGGFGMTDQDVERVVAAIHRHAPKGITMREVK